MTREPRVLAPAEWDRWFDALALAFGGLPEPSEYRELMRTLTETERALAVWDEDTCVGTAGAYRFRVTVPGGELVPATGVTLVSVAPTHRRRGILTAMMRRQLDDVRSWGEPLALLTATEPTIYGRFGYGAATQQLAATIDTSRVALAVPEGTDDVRLREVPPADQWVVDACEALYAAEVPLRPGMIARTPGWERTQVSDPEESRNGRSPLRCALAERDGDVVGFTLFRVRPRRSEGVSEGTVELEHLYASDPAAYASLWRFLFGIDLTTTLAVEGRPVDDPVQHLVLDVRRSRLRVRDALYVRLVEVGPALEARRYRTPVDVVLEVEDAFCPWNEGRWRLTGDTEGATCVRTADQADLALSSRELGSAYLGGISLAALAGAGRVRELRPGALARASAAFASDTAPWLPHGF
jgi:predicted acetyltransferase